MVKHSFTLIITVFITLLSVNLAAPAEPLTLDWNAAWKMALEKSDAILAAGDEWQKANHKVSEAYASAMPTVDFSSSFQHYFEVPSTIFNLPNFDDPSGPSTRIKTQFGSENNIGLSATLSQPLWLAGKIGLALQAAEDYRELSGLSMGVSKVDLKLNLTQAFYGVLVAEEFVKVSQDALTQAERHRKQAQALFDQGMVSEYDLLRAGVAVANIKPQVIAAEIARDLALKALKSIIGLDVDAEVKLMGSLDQDIEPPQPYTSALSQALDKRLEFRQLDLQKSLFGIQYEVEKRGVLWPNFLLNLGWQSQAQKDDFKFNKYEFLGGWGATLVMQVPLFDGFASHHRAEAAKVDIRSVSRQREMLERGVKIQVYQALGEFRKASEELKAAEETLGQADKGLSIAELRYREGVGTQLEALDAQMQLTQSKLNVLQAQYSLLISRAAYERAVGMGVE
ncbi:MAG: TolC family protein [Calditrichota bacterium]